MRFSRKSVIKGIIFLLVVVLCYLEGRRVTFSFECFSAGVELEKNFKDNKDLFYKLLPIVSDAPVISFDIYAKDTVGVSFRDTFSNFADIIIDSNYVIRPGSIQDFRVNDKGCLLVINIDTIEVCDNSWQVSYYGHYMDSTIDNFLNNIGWKRQSFERIFELVQGLNCYGFSKSDNYFKLNYQVVSYYDDGHLHCFGHEDGFFDYLYTTEKDSIYGHDNFDHLEDNFYSVKYWSF